MVIFMSLFLLTIFDNSINKGDNAGEQNERKRSFPSFASQNVGERAIPDVFACENSETKATAFVLRTAAWYTQHIL